MSNIQKSQTTAVRSLDASKNIANWIKTLSDPTKLAIHESQLTVREIIERGVTIREMLFNGVKRSDVHSVVDLQICRLLESFNVKQSMTEYQIAEIVATLVAQYPNESLADFQYVFRMAKLGAFGPVYNRIDISVIMEWMGKYLEHKSAEREQMEREVGKTAPEKMNPMTAEEKEKFYERAMELKHRLDELDKMHRDAKRRGILGMTSRGPRDESEYQKFRAEQFEKYRQRLNQKIDDTRNGGGMGGDDTGTTNRNVSIPNDDGRDDVGSV